MKLLLAMLTSAVVMASGGSGECSPVGNWLAKDGTKIRIAPCGANLCGFIAETSPQNDPDTNKPRTDKHNIDPAKRSRRLIGVPLLIAMKPNGAGRWTGELYKVDDGKTYSGKLIERDQTNVRIEGCVLGICGVEELARLR